MMWKGKDMRKSFKTLGLLACASLFITACSGSGTNSSNEAEQKDASGPVRVWFMQGSISDEAQAYLKTQYEKENPGKKISIEIQPWDGIFARMQTALASKDQAPDLLETGNTQSAAFTSVGALEPLDNVYDQLGGDKLIKSFVEAGEFEGKKYALPLYAGARGIFYRTDLFKKAGIEPPKTLTEFHNDIIKLTKANPDQVANFSGIYLSSQDIHGVESYLFAAGGSYAKLENGKWVGKMSSPESIKGLEQIQDIFKNGTKYAIDSVAGQKSFQNNFNDGRVGILIATGNIGTKIDKKLWDAGKVGVIPIPSNVPNKVGKTFAGGSNISMAKNALHKGAAKGVLKVIFSADFQKLLAKSGWTPGNTTYANEVSGAFGKINKEVIENSELTPNTKNWTKLNKDGTIKDFYVNIAQGKDIKDLAKKLDAKMETVLNEK